MSIFTKLDLNLVFWQLPLSEESKPLTTFITPFGRCHCNVLPYGISSAPEVFQHRIYELLSRVEDVHCILDDILIASTSRQKHLITVNKVLKILSDAGMTLNKIICKYFQTAIAFVSHVAGPEGVKRDLFNIEVLVKCLIQKIKRN